MEKKGIRRHAARLLAVLLVLLTALGGAAFGSQSHAASWQAKQWGQRDLTDSYLSRYDGNSYDHYIKGVPYNHCTGYVSWALRKAYGIPKSAFAMNKPYVRQIRDWVLQNRKKEGFVLVGGGTIDTKTGKIRHTDGYDPQPGDIVFFNTAKNTLKTASTLKRGYAGLKGDWGHVAIIGGNGEMHHDMGGEGYVWKYTPDTLLARNTKAKYLRQGGYSYSYQVWRLAQSVTPKMETEASAGTDGTRNAGRDASARIRGQIRLSGLTEDTMYTLTCALYTADGKPCRDADGNAAVWTRNFRASSAEKTKAVDFTVDTSKMETGGKLVLKAALRRKGEKTVLAEAGGLSDEKSVITVLL